MRLFFSLYTSVSEHCQCFIFTAILDLPICILTRLPSGKHAIKRLHCATSKSSLWYMGYVPRGSAVEHPRIYRTNNCVVHRWLGFSSTAQSDYTAKTGGS